MAKGYGVDVVIAEVARRLKKKSHSVAIGCIDVDGFYRDLQVIPVSGDLASTISLVDELKPQIVAIHTTPFFEQLEDLKKRFPEIKWIVWEHGDPSPDLFPLEAQKRLAEKVQKQQHCYPHADAIVTISKFIARDIGYGAEKPEKVLIYNGCDHAPDFGAKTVGDLSGSGRPLRIGTLARLGKGEAFYKGTPYFVQLVERLRERGIPVVGSFMGRGSEDDAAHLKAQGFETHLNAPDEAKWDFLRGLDVFVSCSQWEGFNLPLVEAQAVGTVSLAFEKGAHSEVSPLAFANLELMVEQICEYSRRRDLLLLHSQMAYRFVRTEFLWDRTAERFESLVKSLLAGSSLKELGEFRLSPAARAKFFVGRVRHFLKIYGFWPLLLKVAKRLTKNR